ncbi:glycerophosphodiester phosphodiesterase [Tepidiforma thermophila]|uniref:Glycerophosphoryl diester phosphodiesterase n=1 Tax=Tepidiforma thermophila (strain KCTC 52669 / CGMCC 1.13589 / G233) TaxID=2761530 RepID=A0A2A9HE43_TEPT2|nr:hypothetical protein [Tepidiforma thermophila]PFG73370.1 glycerophosphoryl diester phosphodiesterase [Tepidiforma thermophila]
MPPELPAGLFAIAHRAGNEPARLAEAVAAGARVVEADLWLHRGHIEVRHTKTAGPLPILWDRWELRPGWGPRLRLPELLELAPAHILLHLDLKGWDDRLGPAVRQAMAALAPGRPYLVSAQRWSLLAPFEAAEEALVVHSIGSARRFERLAGKLGGRRAAAVAIHRELLTPERAERLHALSGAVLTWPVNDPALLGPLAALGVRGVISDSLAIVRAVAPAGAAG